MNLCQKPQISSVSPTAPATDGTGVTLTVNGIFFGTTTGVVWLKLYQFSTYQACTVTSWADSQILCSLPSGWNANAVVFAIKPGYGPTDANGTLSYKPPTIGAHTTKIPTVGGPITLNGNQFGPGIAPVYWTLAGASSATIVSRTYTKIVVDGPVGGKCYSSAHGMQSALVLTFK